MKKSVNEFIDFVTGAIGCYYWFGTFGQTASANLYAEKKKQYPNYYNANDYAEQIKNPKRCFDCAGLVKSLWLYPKYNAADDLGATGIYGKCAVKGPITRDKLKKGILLFKGNDKQKSHVGVYIGDNKIVEAKNHASGVIKSELNDSWKYYAEYYNVDYSDETPAPTPELKFDSDICKFCSGITLTVNTKTDDLMLRSTPEIAENIIASMPKGSKVIWRGYYSGNWYQVQYGNKKGFAYKDYLKL